MPARAGFLGSPFPPRSRPGWPASVREGQRYLFEVARETTRSKRRALIEDGRTGTGGANAETDNGSGARRRGGVRGRGGVNEGQGSILVLETQLIKAENVPSQRNQRWATKPPTNISKMDKTSLQLSTRLLHARQSPSAKLGFRSRNSAAPLTSDSENPRKRRPAAGDSVQICESC
ncbi:alpha/beta-Hydrolases superfamily protein [Striga asiatica]|uniref:Alpha/beta-Hydrolases superfamily protein n=1 Tax=Striga asiatica TaxID=4170 RepID=A0A5A7PJJ4_STRAF|nr:alpha/beta-Hydrolases superfamily protein [Striga asiatica]